MAIRAPLCLGLGARLGGDPQALPSPTRQQEGETPHPWWDERNLVRVASDATPALLPVAGVWGYGVGDLRLHV